MGIVIAWTAFREPASKPDTQPRMRSTPWTKRNRLRSRTVFHQTRLHRSMRL